LPENLFHLWMRLSRYPAWQVLIELALIWIVVYLVFRFLRGTRGARVLKGVALLLVTGYALGFAGLALAFASKTDSSGAYHTLIFLFNLPLLFLSNALYPLDALPRWMQIGALANPTTYVVSGLRQSALGAGTPLAAAETLSLWVCFGAVLLFAALGVGLAYVAFRAAIR